MADRYRVNGGGPWNFTVYWSTTSGGPSGASVPTVNDNAIFDDNSGVGAFTVNDNTFYSIAVHDLDFSARTGGAVTIVTAFNLTVSGSILGSNFRLSPGSIGNAFLEFTSSASEVVHFGSSTGTSDRFNITFTGTGDWTLQSGRSITNISPTIFYYFSVTGGGALDTNGYDITGFDGFYCDNGDLILGSSTISVKILFRMNETGTVSAGTSSIEISGDTYNLRFVGGGKTYYDLTISGAGSGYISLSSDDTFHDLTILPSSFLSLVVADITITGTLTVTGASATIPTIIRGYSDYGIDVSVVTAAAVSLSDCYFWFTTGAGVAAPFTGTRLGDIGNNSGITFGAGTTRYWVVDSGDWLSTSSWSASSGGTPGASVPLPQDNVVFDANSFSSTGSSVTGFLGFCHDFTTTGVTESPSFGINELYINGSLTTALNEGLFQTSFIFTGESDETISIDPTSFDSESSLGVIKAGGSLTQLTDLETIALFSLYAGEFDMGGFDISVYDAYLLNSPLDMTLTMGTGTFIVNDWGTFEIQGEYSEGYGPAIGAKTINPGTSLLLFSFTNEEYGHLVNSNSFNYTFYNISTISAGDFGGYGFYGLVVTATAGGTLTFTNGLFTGDGLDLFIYGELIFTGDFSMYSTTVYAYLSGGEITAATTTTLDNIYVENNTAAGAAIPFVPTSSFDGGGNVNWFFGFTPQVMII
jgi:hypothetical protein